MADVLRWIRSSVMPNSREVASSWLLYGICLLMLINGGGELANGSTVNAAVNVGLGLGFYFVGRQVSPYKVVNLSISRPDNTSTQSVGQEIRSFEDESAIVLRPELALEHVFIIDDPPSSIQLPKASAQCVSRHTEQGTQSVFLVHYLSTQWRFGGPSVEGFLAAHIECEVHEYCHWACTDEENAHVDDHGLHSPKWNDILRRELAAVGSPACERMPSDRKEEETRKV